MVSVHVLLYGSAVVGGVEMMLDWCFWNGPFLVHFLSSLIDSRCIQGFACLDHGPRRISSSGDNRRCMVAGIREPGGNGLAGATWKLVVMGVPGGDMAQTALRCIVCVQQDRLRLRLRLRVR